MSSVQGGFRNWCCQDAEIWQSRSENGKIKKLFLISNFGFVVFGRKSRSGKENTDISLVRLLEPNVHSHTVKHLFTPAYTDT